MADCVYSEPADFGLAHVLPGRDSGTGALGAALGCTITPGPHATGAGAITLWGVAPGQWLAHAEQAGPEWAEALGAQVSGIATVIDQSSGYVLFRLSGADAARVLQKGLPVDLSAQVPGAVTVSAIAHIGVIAHRRAADSFDVAVFRSFAHSFRHWLDATLAGL